MTRTTSALRLAVAAAVLAGGAGPAVSQRAAQLVEIAPVAAPAAAGVKAKGVHIPPGRNVSFNYVMTDSSGSRWDIQYYGTVGQGTNNAYSGGMYLQIQGSNVRASRGQGWVNQTGDEVEIGPYQRNGLQIYRRVKVYKDEPLARWIEIFENPTNRAVTVPVRVYSYLNGGVSRMHTSSGDGSFDDGDWCFITESHRGNNAPSILHVVCDPRSKVRPNVNVQGNSLYVNWNVTVPPGKTVLLCHFESQNPSTDALRKIMGKLKPYRLLRDLPAAARKLILNFPRGAALAEIELERSDQSDTVLLTNGDPMYGEIQADGFAFETFYGPVKLPAERVVGMAPVVGERRVRALLTDGQVVSGRLRTETIRLKLPSGGDMQEIPLARVAQWSYRVTKERPDDLKMTTPMVALRTGDRLAFDPGATELTLLTRHGPVPLTAEAVLEVAMDNEGNAVHRAMFINGGRLAGLLEPAELTFALRLGPRMTVPRNRVGRVVFAAEEKPEDTLTQLLLSNGDELFGEIAAPTLSIGTAFGTVRVRPREIRAMSFAPEQPGRLVVQKWDGAVHRGRLGESFLDFQVRPGPKLRIHVEQIVGLLRNQVLPPEEVRRRVERLVAQLGAESYKDRQAATDALAEMGAGIAPLLKEYLDADDPEVRQRVEEVLERLGAAEGNRPPLPDGEEWQMIID